MTELILREIVFRTGDEDPVVVRDRRPPHDVDITNLRSFVAQSYGDPLEPAWSGKREDRFKWYGPLQSHPTC